MLIKGSVIKADAAVAKENAKGVLRLVGAAATALAVATMVLTAEPAKAESNTLSSATKISLDQTKTFTVAEAKTMSLEPKKQIVFHYDASLSEMHIASLETQLKNLLNAGYSVVALPGGPKGSVQVCVAGRTTDKLIFSQTDILAGSPQNYGSGLYLKLIGQPEKPKETAAVAPERL